jgi:hypothetical protein
VTDRPVIELSPGELGLCVWALGLLAANVEEESGADLLCADIEQLVGRLRRHHADLADWIEPPTVEEPPDDSPF